MRTGLDFNRILEEKLGAPTFAWSSPATSAPQAGPAWRPGARPVFLCGDAASGFSAGCSRRPATTEPETMGGAGVHRPRQRGDAWRVAPRHDTIPGRPARPLSSGQLQALGRLREFGARWLGPHSTDDEIRSAYRALAREFHPDANLGAGEAELARLAQTFAAVSDAYRALTAPVTH